MAGQITLKISRGMSGGGINPLSAQWSQVGSVVVSISENMAAGGSAVLVAASWLAGGTAAGDLVALQIIASQPMVIQTNGNGTIGVQTITVTGSPTGGTFVLGFAGQVTAPIAWNAAASAVQTALRALSTVGSTGVTCTGGPLPGTPVVCTFSPTLFGSSAVQSIPLMTFNIAGLTGGAPVMVVANSANVPQDVISLSAGIPFAWDLSSGAYPFGGPVTAWYVTNTNSGSLRASYLTY